MRKLLLIEQRTLLAYAVWAWGLHSLQILLLAVAGASVSALALLVGIELSVSLLWLAVLAWWAWPPPPVELWRKITAYDHDATATHWILRDNDPAWPRLLGVLRQMDTVESVVCTSIATLPEQPSVPAWSGGRPWNQVGR